MYRPLAFAASCTLALTLAGSPARADVPAHPALALIPYEEPGTGDPHAAEVTKSLMTALAQKNVPVTLAAQSDHVEAVAKAASVCAATGSAGLLIAEGRYEQTRKEVHVPFAGQITSFPTRVELRLDQFDCSGKQTWTKATSCDANRSGVMFSPTNVGSIIDECFRRSAAELASLDGAPAPLQPVAPPAADPAASTPASSPAAGPSSADNSVRYVLVPFEQPGIADPRAPDMTRSLASAIKNRRLAVDVSEPLDRLTVIAQAAALCARFHGTEIVVPEARVEQTIKTHGELRLVSVSCEGHVRARAMSTADVSPSFFGLNAGAAMVQATERATGAALDQLLAPSGSSASSKS